LIWAKNKQLQKIDNQIDDLLHKLSRKLIEMLLERGVSTVVIGELGEITRSVSYGSQMNQRLSQWAHGKFAQMLEYKARGAGMDVEYEDEAYTSQTCPKCGTAKSSHKNGREFRCSNCDYTAHRDIVGAENIRRKYVGRRPARLPGAMASPSGVRFQPHLQCSSRSDGRCMQVAA